MRSVRHANDIQSAEPIGYGAYVCLTVPPGTRPAAAGAPVPELADRLRLRNEYQQPGDEHSPGRVAFLRRMDAAAADITDETLLHADAIVHVAAAAGETVAKFCDGLAGLLGSPVGPRVLSGVMRPKYYTGNAMHNFAYAHRVMQQPGPVMPHAFLLPLSKTAAWWEKDWMERHTYFLPRYDESGRMLHDGHALAAAPGISCLLRRTYASPVQPAPAGSYDFLTYFECSDEDVPRFHEVCAALRDTRKNPEWGFVREGPTWHGRRVAGWAELFA